MLMLLNSWLQRVRGERGVVSVEWIILAAVVMAAIVIAFAPTFQQALKDAVTAVSGELQTQVGKAGS